MELKINVWTPVKSRGVYSTIDSNSGIEFPFASFTEYENDTTIPTLKKIQSKFSLPIITGVQQATRQNK